MTAFCLTSTPDTSASTRGRAARVGPCRRSRRSSISCANTRCVATESLVRCSVLDRRRTVHRTGSWLATIAASAYSSIAIAADSVLIHATRDPTRCRPRAGISHGRSVIDQRGTFISLSHFCPTAAAMLLARDTLSIVEALPPLRLSGAGRGTGRQRRAAAARPAGCSLRHSRATTPGSVAACRVFARADLSFERCLDLVAAATEYIRAWRPGASRSRIACGPVSQAAYGRAPTWNWSPACDRACPIAHDRTGWRRSDDHRSIRRAVAR